MPNNSIPLLRRIDKPVCCCRSAAWFNWILSTRGACSELYLREKPRRAAPEATSSDAASRHVKGGAESGGTSSSGSVKDWMTFLRSVSDIQLVRLAINQLMRREMDVIDVCVAEAESPSPCAVAG